MIAFLHAEPDPFVVGARYFGQQWIIMFLNFLKNSGRENKPKAHSSVLLEENKAEICYKYLLKNLLIWRSGWP
jgi:hypothetical protein